MIIVHCKVNIQKGGQIMKEVIDKEKFIYNSVPEHLILNYKNIFDQKKTLPIALMNNLLTLD